MPLARLHMHSCIQEICLRSSFLVRIAGGDVEEGEEAPPKVLQLPIIVKADVAGSLEALVSSLSAVSVPLEALVSSLIAVSVPCQEGKGFPVKFQVAFLIDA